MSLRIIYANEAGRLVVVIPVDATMNIEQIAARSVPEGVAFDVVDEGAIPKDRTFRDGWEKHGKNVRHNLTRCKEIAHEKRREARADEFEPLDVEATIPSQAAQAEEKRKAVRDKYAAMQTAIDGAADVAALKKAIGIA